MWRLHSYREELGITNGESLVLEQPLNDGCLLLFQIDSIAHTFLSLILFRVLTPIVHLSYLNSYFAIFISVIMPYYFSAEDLMMLFEFVMRSPFMTFVIHYSPDNDNFEVRIEFFHRRNRHIVIIPANPMSLPLVRHTANFLSNVPWLDLTPPISYRVLTPLATFMPGED